MIELIITLCLLSDPTKCHDVSIPFSSDEGLTPYSCIMRSPARIAKHLEAHPELYPKRWTCRYAGREQET